jgi:SRSO17 transposase
MSAKIPRNGHFRQFEGDVAPMTDDLCAARSEENFPEGLLSEERRKTGWMRAEAAGDPGPWRQQAILGRGQWDADALRDIVRDYVLEALADDAVLVVDERGVLKQGKASFGVGRQYTGSAGKITNCQIGVSPAMSSKRSISIGWSRVDRSASILTRIRRGA